MGAKGLARAKVGEGGEWTQSPFAKTITPEMRLAMNAAMGAQPGDLVLFQFGKPSTVHTVMANLRVHLAKKMGLIPEYGSGGKWNFLWVVDPPLFEYDEEAGHLGRRAPRLHAPARPGPALPRDRSRQGLLLALRPGAERLRDRRRLHPSPRPRGPGPGLPRHGHLRRGRPQQVRLPARRPQDGRAAARRHRARHGPAGHAAHRRRVAARRGGLAQDPEGHRSDDRGPGRRRREAAPRALREEHRRARGSSDPSMAGPVRDRPTTSSSSAAA